MNYPEFINNFSVLDMLALFWFGLCWIGYIHFADHTRFHKKSVSAIMNSYRQTWMQNMMQRDPRMLDALMQGNLLHGVAFFASTSILLIGGTVAMLGATEKAILVLQELPFAQQANATLWEVKVLLMAYIFIYAFFKFAWSYRLYKYCSVLIGAAPLETKMNARTKEYAKHAAQLQNLAAGHFNNGLRAYFFALGALSWFIHPILFLLVTNWVIWILYRREFRSRSWRLLQKGQPSQDE